MSPKKSVQSKVGGAPVHTTPAESAAKIAEKETCVREETLNERGREKEESCFLPPVKGSVFAKPICSRVKKLLLLLLLQQCSPK